jgi:hypothetical protein
MPKDPKFIDDFKAYARANLNFIDLPILEKELFGSNDRATAVMMASVVDMAIQNLLIKRLRSDLKPAERRDLFGERGPLGTFSAKINMAYAVGAIGPIAHADLHLIRTIRNEFAHSRRSFDFSTPETANVCAHLQIPDLPGAIMPSGFGRDFATIEEWNNAVDKNNPKQRYLMATHTIATQAIIGLQALAAVSTNETGIP